MFPHISYDSMYLIGKNVNEQRAVLTIQRKYREYYMDKLYEKKMIDEGYFKLTCGGWSNGFGTL